MANWSVKATSAALDSTNPGNLNVTFTATNSVTSEIVTQVAPAADWTINKAKAFAETFIEQLNARDAARASASAALGPIQTFINTNTVLATG